MSCLCRRLCDCECVWVSLCVFASACGWGSLRRGQRCWRQLTLAPTRLVCNKTSDSARWAKTAICGWKTGSSLDWILVNNTSEEEEEARNHESPPWQDQQQPDLWIFKSFQIAKSEADYEARKWSTNIMCTCLKSSNMKWREGEGEWNSKYVQVKCFRKTGINSTKETQYPVMSGWINCNDWTLYIAC